MEAATISTGFRILSRGGVLAAAFLSAIAVCAGAANLVANPGFEDPGSTNNIPGWTFWRATWGGGETAQAVTGAEVSGNRGLMLTCGSSSFGVYQEVTVTPGKVYRIDGWWKGSFTSGTDAWYDCELLDGPFNLTTADNRPYDLAYKYCTYDLAQANWDWERMSDAYYTVLPLLQDISTITRNGIRYAKTTKLTVVLKTGGFSHPYGYYDDILLEEVPLTSLAAAKSMADGTTVAFDGVVNAVFAKQCYMQSENRAAGIRVDFGTASGIRAGVVARTSGILRTSSEGERYLESSFVVGLSSSSVRPLAMPLLSLSIGHDPAGPSTLGLLVRVTGKVVYIDSHSFDLSDGSGCTVRCVTPSTINVDPSMTFASVTGVSSLYLNGTEMKRLLRVRASSDITPTAR